MDCKVRRWPAVPTGLTCGRMQLATRHPAAPCVRASRAPPCLRAPAADGIVLGLRNALSGQCCMNPPPGQRLRRGDEVVMLHPGRWVHVPCKAESSIPFLLFMRAPHDSVHSQCGNTFSVLLGASGGSVVGSEAVAARQRWRTAAPEPARAGGCMLLHASHTCRPAAQLVATEGCAPRLAGGARRRLGLSGYGPLEQPVAVDPGNWSPDAYIMRCACLASLFVFIILLPGAASGKVTSALPTRAARSPGSPCCAAVEAGRDRGAGAH